MLKVTRQDMDIVSHSIPGEALFHTTRQGHLGRRVLWTHSPRCSLGSLFQCPITLWRRNPFLIPNPNKQQTLRKAPNLSLQDTLPNLIFKSNMLNHPLDKSPLHCLSWYRSKMLISFSEFLSEETTVSKALTLFFYGKSCLAFFYVTRSSSLLHLKPICICKINFFFWQLLSVDNFEDWRWTVINIWQDTGADLQPGRFSVWLSCPSSSLHSEQHHTPTKSWTHLNQRLSLCKFTHNPAQDTHPKSSVSNCRVHWNQLSSRNRTWK